jgi:hypothetical protein
VKRLESWKRKKEERRKKEKNRRNSEGKDKCREAQEMPRELVANINGRGYKSSVYRFQLHSWPWPRVEAKTEI